MVCRGDRPPKLHFYGLTAAYELPQRVVGYRPTSRFFPTGYRVAVHLALRLPRKIKRDFC